MPSIYSKNLRIELIGTGEQAGVWGSTTNRNLGTLIEQAITGLESIDLSHGDVTLTVLNSAADQARNASLVFTGLPAGTTTVTIPIVDKRYMVYNKTDQEVQLDMLGGAEPFKCPPKSISNISVCGDEIKFFGYSITEEVAKVLSTESFEKVIEDFDLATLESPNFTGEPTVPTPPDSDKSKRIANTEFVVANGTPIGGVIMWWGVANDVPDGWAICDGSNGTPDMRGRVPLGVSGNYERGNTGGYEDATLVEHNHGGRTGTQDQNHTHSGNTASAGAHSHSVTVNSGGAHTHSGSTNNTGGHTHTRGSMEIGGVIGKASYQLTGPASGAFRRDQGSVTFISGSSQSPIPYSGDSGFSFRASRNWTGSTSNSGAHSHSVTINSGGAHAHSASSASAGAHTHSFSTGNESQNHRHSISSSGEDAKGKNMPPYKALYFIMRVE